MGEKIIYKCIYRRMIKWGKNSYINVHVFRKDVNYLYFIIKINFC